MDYIKKETDLERARKGWKIGVFDIETTDLDAHFGELICIVIQNLSDKGFIYGYRIDDYKKEKDLLYSVIRELNNYDMLIGWNSSGFDFPFLNTRALIHGLKPPERHYRRDLLYVARGNLRLHGYSLRSVSEKLLGRTRKTRTTPDIKRGIIKHTKDALDFTYDHCIKDVKDTMDLYKKFIPILGKPRIK